jgi:hypothetical protein
MKKGKFLRINKYLCVMIKNIVFDLGGVVIALSYEQAVRRFDEIGLDVCA